MKFIDSPLYAQQIVIIMLILTLVLSIVGVFVTIILCRKKHLTIVAICTFVLSFMSVFLIMRGSYLHRANRPGFEPSLTFLSLPFWIICFITVLLLSLIVCELIFAIKWNKKHISLISIKESVDNLPAGICFFDINGLVRLINKEMNDISLLLTGKTLLNGNEFWNYILKVSEKQNHNYASSNDEIEIKLSDDKVISFHRYLHIIEEKEIYEVDAIEITELYKLTKELEVKSNELKDINKRLILYGENVKELIAQKEILATKIRIHDEIGKLLIITKKKLLDELNEQDRTELLDMWNNEINAFKSVQHKEKKDNLQVIKDVAKIIGVTVSFKGVEPKKETINEKILNVAMHECLTNAVKHANSKKLDIEGNLMDNNYVIVITNDGKKPKEEIVEGGGLSALRTLVEQNNGKMQVLSKPRFKLIIILKEEV